MPVLTARPTPAEEALVPHKLYGILGADEQGSVGKWLRMAIMEIDWARSQNITPIVVGGTGLYMKALIEGLNEIPDISADIRQQASNDFEQMGKEGFLQRLREIDPAWVEKFTVHDKQRLIRAYAVWLGSAKPLSFWQNQSKNPSYIKDDFAIEIIELPREELYERCNARFIKMIEQGAIDQVKSLGNPPPHALLNIIGVWEISEYLQGIIPLEKAISQAQQATRNYAKRQVTWFKNQLVST